MTLHQRLTSSHTPRSQVNSSNSNSDSTFMMESSSFSASMGNDDEDGEQKTTINNNNTKTSSNDNPKNDNPSDEISLQDRILQIIGTCPNRTIRPAVLTAQLGSLSVEDATAELCSLLAAVGGGENGASFYFETVQASSNDDNDKKTNTTALATSSAKPQHVMVFTFPPDFVQRAQRAKRQQDWKESMQAMATFVWKIVQIITAMGLILSLLILTVAAMLAMVAALIALQREGRSNNRHLTRQIQHLCLMVREMLWCFAMFGPDMEDQDEHGNTYRDPFLRELAYDMALWSSVCCGHPGSIFYWYRVRQLSRRRRNMTRGWRRHNAYQDVMESDDVDGVQLVRQRRGNNDNSNEEMTALTTRSNNQHSTVPNPNSHRGILSVAVEFLFGPQEQQSQATTDRLVQDKWKLRAAFLVQQSTINSDSGGGVSLQEMSPYTDDPPASLETEAYKLVTEGLLLVSHFQGMPLASSTSDSSNDMATARFVFPQLVSESSVALQYNKPKDDGSVIDDGTWSSILFQQTDDMPTHSPVNNDSTSLPNHYREPLLRLTHLSPTQFTTCAALGMLNLIGVIWFRQATSAGGVMMEVIEFQALARTLRRWLVPVLVFYALLFWFLPLSRLLYVVVANRRRRGRNARRQYLAKVVLASK